MLEQKLILTYLSDLYQHPVALLHLPDVLEGHQVVSDYLRDEMKIQSMDRISQEMR